MMRQSSRRVHLYLCSALLPLIPVRKRVVGLPAAQPAGTMDFSLGKSAALSVRPGVQMLAAATEKQDLFFAADCTFPLAAVVTTIVVH